jgi:hypothetical protein
LHESNSGVATSYEIRANLQAGRPLPATDPGSWCSFYPAPRQAKSTQISLGHTQLLARRPFKIVAIALANKMARIAWALLAKGENLSKASACGSLRAQEPADGRVSCVRAFMNCRVMTTLMRNGRDRRSEAPKVCALYAMTSRQILVPESRIIEVTEEERR